MLKVHSLPANHGDCIWIEYGNKEHPSHILIDGGTGESDSYAALEKKICAIKGRRHFELLVVTHIDADHIGGVLRLLQERKSLGVTFGDIWFNGYYHLDPNFDDMLGPVQGEALSELLVKQKLPWNKAFGGGAVVIPKDNKLPSVTLGEMKLTILSPTKKALETLMPKWEKCVKNAGLLPGAAMQRSLTDPLDDLMGHEAIDESIDVAKLATGNFRSDRSPANRSSIAILTEYAGKSCLFAGDAHAKLLNDSISLLTSGDDKLKLDLFKLPHHGSKGNVNKTLIKKVKCKNYLVSTNGDRFQHPDKEAMARVIFHSEGKPRILFNYTSTFNGIWDNTILKNDNSTPYKTSYARSNKSGISKKLS